MSGSERDNQMVATVEASILFTGGWFVEIYSLSIPVYWSSRSSGWDGDCWRLVAVNNVIAVVPFIKRWQFTERKIVVTKYQSWD